jgi:hypothetical protein
MHYAWWRNNVLLTLRRYSLSDHVLLDTTYVGILAPDLQDVNQQRCQMARSAWMALENYFLSNRETCTLHIEGTFQSFIQGDLSINDYCRKMKGFTSVPSSRMRRPLPGGNLAGNSGVAGHCPHHPLSHVDASVILFLHQWAGTPARIAAAPAMPSTTTAATVRQEKE